MLVRAVLDVLGRRTPELVWYLKHAPRETAVCPDCLYEAFWRDGKIKKKKKTDEVKRGELSPGVCLAVGVSDSLGRLIASQG